MQASTLPQAEAALRTIEGDWTAGAAHWNPLALGQIYTDDAIFFGGRPGISIGQKAVTAYFYSYMDVIRSATLKLADQYVIEIAADTYHAQGYGEFTFGFGDGRRSQSVLRTTLLIVKRDGQWRVQAHHLSSSPEASPPGDD